MNLHNQTRIAEITIATNSRSTKRYQSTDSDFWEIEKTTWAVVQALAFIFWAGCGSQEFNRRDCLPNPLLDVSERLPGIHHVKAMVAAIAAWVLTQRHYS